MSKVVIVRDLGQTLYSSVYLKMREYTRSRNMDSLDEIWLTEHLSIFTMGQSAKEEHLLVPGSIPVFYCDRGGQVTYHGPGQLTVYLLFDIRRMRLNIRELVNKMEDVMLACLKDFGIRGQRIKGAPGVYVRDQKIGALGLRVTKGRTYHGMSLNVEMDLEPFSRINPCGVINMEVTHIAKFKALSMNKVKEKMLHELAACFEIKLSILDNFSIV